MRPQPRNRPRWRWDRRKSIFYALHPDRLPVESIRLSYTFGLGGVSVLAGLIAIITGVLLTFYYAPTPEQAYSSVTVIEDLVAYGSLIRALHYWSAQLLVVAITLHLARVVFTGAFGRPRRLNWLVGVALLVLTLLWSFSGYILRWDESTLWALLVGTNLFKTIPLWGNRLYVLLVGDVQIGAPALLRFYAWHVIGLTAIVAFGVVYHLFRLRVDGGISRPPLAPGERRAFAPKEALFAKEIAAALAVSAALVLLSSLHPAPLAGPALLDQPPAEAKAPWLFLWVQELLRWLPPFLAGVAIPLLVALLLAALPWLARPGRVGVWFDRGRWPAQAFVIILAVIIAGLTVVAALR